MKTTYLIFDFDGVLADTYASHIQARFNIGSAKDIEDSKTLTSLYFDNKHDHGRDRPQSLEERKRSQEWILLFGKELKRLGFKMFDHFIKEVKKIPHTQIAIVSSGAREYVKERSLACGLNPTHVLTFEDHHSKEEKIELIANDWNVSVKDIYYITDSKADVYELVGFLDPKKILGVAWGYCGEKKLLEVLPENQILKAPEDIHKMLEYGPV